jgi:hypothetical protein
MSMLAVTMCPLAGFPWLFSASFDGQGCNPKCPDFSIGFGTEIEDERFNVLPLALLLAVVALMTAYVVRRRRKAGKKP